MQELGMEENDKKETEVKAKQKERRGRKEPMRIVRNKHLK
jgi:hypothetical protein